MVRVFAVVLLFLAYLVASSTSSGSPKRTTISSEELEAMLNDIRGNDLRLMRWNAKSHTRRRQHNGGCNSLPEALNTILESQKGPDTKQRIIDVTNAMEYTTFCVTDNPEQRSIFSTHDEGLHGAVVNFLSLDTLTANDDEKIKRSASAMAGHVIYITTFANAKNQQEFFNAGAVEKLSRVILDESSSQVQIMWAAAALQNMLASYCDTEGNGRCSWQFTKEWKKNKRTDDGANSKSNPNPPSPQLIVSPEMTVVSDGQPIRETVRKDEELIRHVVDLVNRGPVNGIMSDENPYVGDNAKAGLHDDSPNIVAWAAAGVIKNASLDPVARAYLKGQDFWTSLRFSLCRLEYSPDWLEQNKGGSALEYLLPEDTCWFEDEQDPYSALCMDDIFVDEEGYTCADYNEKVTVSECRALNLVDKTKTANDSCCNCGGGTPDEKWTKKIPKVEREEL